MNKAKCFRIFHLTQEAQQILQVGHFLECKPLPSQGVRRTCAPSPFPRTEQRRTAGTAASLGSPAAAWVQGACVWGAFPQPLGQNGFGPAAEGSFPWAVRQKGRSGERSSQRPSYLSLVFVKSQGVFTFFSTPFRATLCKNKRTYPKNCCFHCQLQALKR